MPVAGDHGRRLRAARARPRTQISTTPNWTIHTAGWNRSSSPVIADIERRRRPRDVVGHEDGYVRVLDADGTRARRTGRSPRHEPAASPTAIDSSPAVADLDRNGHKEIVVGVGSTFQAEPQRRRDRVPQRRIGAVPLPHVATRSTSSTGGGPDGYSDGVLLDARDRRRQRRRLPRHRVRELRPLRARDRPQLPRALGLPVHRRRHDLVVARALRRRPRRPHGDLHRQRPDARRTRRWQGGEFHALDWQNGSVRELWQPPGRRRRSSRAPRSATSTATAGPKSIVGAGNFFNRADGHRVFAFDARDGATAARLAGAHRRRDVLVARARRPRRRRPARRRDREQRRRAAGLQGQRRPLWATHLPFERRPGDAITASPIIADMNGDGHNDVGVGNDCGFFVLDGRTGHDHSRAQHVQELRRVGRGRQLRLARAGGSSSPASTPAPHEHARVVLDSDARRVTPPWPMFHRTATHIGAPASGGNPLPPNQCRASSNPPPHESAASGQGYWFVDRLGAIYSFGGAHYLGGLPGLGADRRRRGDHREPRCRRLLDPQPVGRRVQLRRRARSTVRWAARTLNAPIIGMSATPQRQRLLAARPRRRRVLASATRASTARWAARTSTRRSSR